jgi:hypothetical protein
MPESLVVTKTFSHHPMVECVEWQPIFFWSPSNTTPLFDGDQIFRMPRKGGGCHIFWKTLVKDFPKTYEIHLSIATKMF